MKLLLRGYYKNVAQIDLDFNFALWLDLSVGGGREMCLLSELQAHSQKNVTEYTLIMGSPCCFIKQCMNLVIQMDHHSLLIGQVAA